MSGRDLDRDDARVAAALREGLAARDRSMPPARFATLWQTAGTIESSASRWRPAFAALAAVAVLAGLSWAWINRSGAPDPSRIEASLARELSSPDYWLVPTDELLAFAAPPLSADLPSPTGFQVSLEESLL